MSVLSFIFPERCVACGKIVNGTGFCPDCRSDLTVCKNAAPRHREFLKFVSAPFFYRGAAKSAVLGLKRKGFKSAARFMADEIIAYLQKIPSVPPLSAVTSVPMAPEKLRKKGFNHAELIAKAAAKNLNLPYIRLLRKTGSDESQHTLGMNERAQNAAGSYSCTQDVSGHLLLIDDVITTGATANSCALALIRAGAASVTAAAFAYTNK